MNINHEDRDIDGDVINFRGDVERTIDLDREDFIREFNHQSYND